MELRWFFGPGDLELRDSKLVIGAAQDAHIQKIGPPHALVGRHQGTLGLDPGSDLFLGATEGGEKPERRRGRATPTGPVEEEVNYPALIDHTVLIGTGHIDDIRHLEEQGVAVSGDDVEVVEDRRAAFYPQEYAGHSRRSVELEDRSYAAAVLDPNTHYVVNLSNIPEFASALTVAIEKIADPDSAALAIYEISAFRERRGRFGQRVAHISAEKMSPTEWWFQFGGDVPNLQKYALRIVSQCVSSSGCERNWSAWALVHTKQRNRLLYGKLHKFVSVRHNLKIRAEEDKDRVRENDKYKEVDPCAMMMNTTMFDEANPMMEWLNEDEEHVILDGSDAASAVFEEIRRLNSSKKSSHLGRKGNGTKRKRVLEEDEDDYIDCDDDEEEDDYIDIDDEDECGDDSASEADGEDSTTRVEKDQPSQDGNEVEERNDGGLLNCRRSRPGKQSTKLKDLTSLYN
ncbi:uncharacterized protein LOC123396332 [Hordeum vulgare subsp. vulgare]|uniref:uncharacterized protein LOC123396332 n=1 Tax=Hordeum vulgare subsp. vulgare TaxID=112509 RepID=UPI00162D0581|nr:uncharacterized protein LOC123396332 [Hordeum vulgare subsp. vulgare]